MERGKREEGHEGHEMPADFPSTQASVKTNFPSAGSRPQLRSVLWILTEIPGSQWPLGVSCSSAGFPRSGWKALFLLHKRSLVEDFMEDPSEILFEELPNASGYLKLGISFQIWTWHKRLVPQKAEWEDDPRVKGKKKKRLRQTLFALKAVVKFKLTLVYEGHSRSLHSIASQRISFQSPVRKTK